MTTEELKQIVEQQTISPSVLGRLASNLHGGDYEQKHTDGRQLLVSWQNLGDFWRCTITSAEGTGPFAKVDLHENATVKIEAHEPCSITVCPEEGVLCLTRYRYDA